MLERLTPNARGQNPLHVAVKMGLKELIPKLNELCPQWQDQEDNYGCVPVLPAPAPESESPIAEALGRSMVAVTRGAGGGIEELEHEPSEAKIHSVT